MIGAARAASLTLLLALAALPPGASGPVDSAAAAQSPRTPLPVAGTWDAVWRNGRGEARKGLIVVEQRGAELSARIESHGNVTATGTIAGATFVLRGTRLGVPFTVSGRVNGRRMTGTLTAILVERHFTAVRRRDR